MGVRELEVGWIQVAQDGVHWWSPVGTAVNLCVTLKARNVLTSIACCQVLKKVCCAWSE
jgi:hypothetical protein